MENNSNQFKIIDKDGNEIVCEVLFTFESDETNKNYIVYTDNTCDKDGNTKVYASIYNPDGESTTLMPIETDREWKVVETTINLIQEKANSEKE